MFNEKFLQKSLFETDWFVLPFSGNDSAYSLFLANTTKLFSQSLSSHTLCSLFEILSTSKDLCNFCRTEFQKVSTQVFCSWDDIFTQKKNCGFHNTMCKCTEPLSTFSTNTSLYIKTTQMIPTDAKGIFHRKSM